MGWLCVLDPKSKKWIPLVHLSGAQLSTIKAVLEEIGLDGPT